MYLGIKPDLSSCSKKVQSCYLVTDLLISLTTSVSYSSIKHAWPHTKAGLFQRQNVVTQRNKSLLCSILKNGL